MNETREIEIRAQVGMDSTYLTSDGCEVKPTGKYASKIIGSESGRRARRVVIQHEVTPIDPEVNWTKWVTLSDLFIVHKDTE